jgi:predicted transcriptional regulator
MDENTTSAAPRAAKREPRTAGVATTVTAANKRRLDAIARREDRTVASVLNRIIEEYFDRVDAENPTS